MSKFKKENQEEKAVDPLLDSESGAESSKEEQAEVKPVQEAAPKPVQKRSITTEAQKAVVDNIEGTKRRLAAQPQVQIMIPVDSNDKAGLPEECIINGFKTIVPKGQYVTVPQAVANMIATKYKINQEAGAGMKRDRAKDVDEALS